MDIPVFHDDQHGTAIISTAGLINALGLTGRDIKETRARLQRRGRGRHRLPRSRQGDGLLAAERHSLRHQGRRLSRPHRRHEPVEERACGRDDERTLAEALDGADIFFGLSVKGALTPDMVQDAWRRDPIIFAMANPDPEITPEDALAARPDAIIATGRSDYPEPDQQCSGLPLHLPRRARRARQDDQHGNEDRRGESPRRAGARGRAGRGGRRLSGRAAALRPRLS